MTREEWRGLTAFTVILLIFSAYSVVGIGAAVESASDPEQNVYRDLPSGTQAPGSVITVSLDVTVGSAIHYIIDEEVPSRWTVTGASDGGNYIEPGHVKWVVTSDAADKTLTYTVQIPDDADGTCAFSGVFQMEGMGSPDSIDCDTIITVEGTSSDSNDLGTTTETNDPETNDQETNDQETNDQETNDQETNDQETNDQETNDQETNDQETDDESSSESTASASTTLKSAATTQSAADDSAEEVPASEAGSSMFAIIIGAIVIVSYKLKEN